MAKRKIVAKRKERTVFETKNRAGEIVYGGKYKKAPGKYPEVSLGKKSDDFDLDDALHKLTQFWRGEIKSKYELKLEAETQEKIALVTTWDGFWKKYGANIDKHSRLSSKKSSFKGRENLFRKHVRSYFDKKSIPPHLITLEDGKAFNQHVLGMDCSGGHKRNIVELLKRVLRFNGQLSCIDLELPVANPKDKILPTTTQVDNLMAILWAEAYVYDGKTYKMNRTIGDCMILMRFTGMRSLETRKLMVKDLDFERKIITLREPKGGKTAQIPMPDKVIALLSGRLSIGDLKPDDYVFAARDGGMLPNYSHVAKKYCIHAGMPEGFAPCHGLRFLFASELNKNGTPLPNIQKLLTHKNVTTTMTYIGVDWDELLDAANTIG